MRRSSPQSRSSTADPVLPTPLEIEEARARWRELAGADAGLGPIAAFHDERLAQLLSGSAPDIDLSLSPADAERAIAAGEPLLAAGSLAFDDDELADELGHVARNLSETALVGTPAHDTATKLAETKVDVAALALPALQNDLPAVERAAASLGVDATALGELVQLALQPILWEASRQAAALTELDRWERGYCLCCGAWPGLAELIGTEKRRVLRCVRCGSGWSWLVLLCPYCGTDDHRDLGILELGPDETGGVESRGHRIDVCERCHGYVKAVQTFTSNSAVRLVAEDVATLYLDAAATQAGYRRPGDVDAQTAGIPRLAREGRSV